MNLDTTSALSTGFASKIGTGDLALYITEHYLLGAYPPLLTSPSPNNPHPATTTTPSASHNTFLHPTVSNASLSPQHRRPPSSSSLGGGISRSTTRRITSSSTSPTMASLEPHRHGTVEQVLLTHTLLRPVQLHPTGTTGSALDQLLDPTCATLEHSQLKHKSTFNPHHRWFDHIRATSSLSKLKELSSTSTNTGDGANHNHQPPAYHASTVLGLTAGLGLPVVPSTSSVTPSDVPTLSSMGPLVRRVLGRLLGPTIDHSHCGHLVSSGLYLHSLLGHHQGGISAFRISLEREATAKKQHQHNHYDAHTYAPSDSDVNISDDDEDYEGGDDLSMNPLAEHMRIGGLSSRSKRLNTTAANRKKNMFNDPNNNNNKPRSAVVSESMKVSVCIASPSFLTSSKWEDYPLLRAIVTLIVASPPPQQPTTSTSTPRTPQARIPWIQALCGINATAFLRRVVVEEGTTTPPTDEAITAAHDVIAALEELFVVPKVSSGGGGYGGDSASRNNHLDDVGSLEVFIRRLVCIVVAMEVRVVRQDPGKSTTTTPGEHSPGQSKAVCELTPFTPVDEAGIRGLAHMLTHIKWELAAATSSSSSSGPYQNDVDVEVTMSSLLSVLRTRPVGDSTTTQSPTSTNPHEQIVPLKLCMLPDELYCTATRQLERAWQRRVAACYVFPVEGGLLAKTSVATAGNVKRALSVLRESCGGDSGALLTAGVRIRDTVHVVGCAAHSPIPTYTPPPPQLPPTAVPMPVATGHFSDINANKSIVGLNQTHRVNNTSTAISGGSHGASTTASQQSQHQQHQHPLGTLLGNAAFDLYTSCVAHHCDQEDALAEARNALDQLSFDIVNHNNNDDDDGGGGECGLNLYGKVVSALEGRRKLEKKQVRIAHHPNNGDTIDQTNEADDSSAVITTHHSFDTSMSGGGVMRYNLHDSLPWPVGLTQQQDLLLAAPDTASSFGPNRKRVVPTTTPSSKYGKRGGHTHHKPTTTTPPPLTLASCFAPGTTSTSTNLGNDDGDYDYLNDDMEGGGYSSPSRWGRVLELTSLGSANQSSLVRKLGEVVKTDTDGNTSLLKSSGSFRSGVPLSSSSHRTAAAQLKTKREAERLSTDKNPALTAASAKFTKYRQSAIVDPEFLAFVHELLSRSCKSLVRVFSPVLEATRGTGSNSTNSGSGGASSIVRDTSAVITLHLVAPPPPPPTTSSHHPHANNTRRQHHHHHQPSSSYDVLRHTAYHVGITTSLASQLLQAPPPPSSISATNHHPTVGSMGVGNMTSIHDTQCTSSMTFDEFAGKYFPLILHQADVMDYMRARQESTTPLGDAAFVLLLCDTLHMPQGSYILGGSSSGGGVRKRRGDHADVELLGEREVVHGDGHIHLYPSGIHHLESLGTDPLPPPSPLTSPRKARRDSRDKPWKAGSSNNGGSRRGSMQRSVEDEEGGGGGSRRSSVTSEVDVFPNTSSKPQRSRPSSEALSKHRDYNHDDHGEGRNVDSTRTESPAATDPSHPAPAPLVRKGSSALFAPKSSLTSTRQQMAEAKHKSRTVKSPLHAGVAAAQQQQQQRGGGITDSVASSASQRSDVGIPTTTQPYKPPVFVADEPTDEASFMRIAASREAHYQSVLSRSQRRGTAGSPSSPSSPPRTGTRGGKTIPAPLSETALKRASRHYHDDVIGTPPADVAVAGSRVGEGRSTVPSQHQPQQPIGSVYSAARSMPSTVKSAPPTQPSPSVNVDVADDPSLLPPWKRGGALADHVRMNNSARHRIDSTMGLSPKPKPKTAPTDSSRSSPRANTKSGQPQNQQRSTTPTTGGKVVSYSDWINMMNNTLGTTTPTAMTAHV